MPRPLNPGRVARAVVGTDDRQIGTLSIDRKDGNQIPAPDALLRVFARNKRMTTITEQTGGNRRDSSRRPGYD